MELLLSGLLLSPLALRRLVNWLFSDPSRRR
jgi:hypothetical protein